MSSTVPGTADLVVIGGGVIGITAALTYQRRHPGDRVVVIEKEPRTGLHASGRNSGVLHAGIYYGANSLKARFCAEGNRRWRQWSEERGVPLHTCGKLVVARTPEESVRLRSLYVRARMLGVDVHLVSEEEARTHEPRVRTVEHALWSPTTASYEPHKVMRHLTEQAQQLGVRILLGARVRGHFGDIVHTQQADIRAGKVLNAAGAHADEIAHEYGFGRDFHLVPFRGLYLRGRVPPGWLRTHVYPIPSPNLPFLGVHFTVQSDGGVMLGPNAGPALGREHYGWLRGLRPMEMPSTTLAHAHALRGIEELRALARRELPVFVRKRMHADGALLVEGFEGHRWRGWGQPGIRAQLVHRDSGRWIHDFRVEGDEQSIHVLNAVSPAFTCAWPFAEYLVDCLQEGGIVHTDRIAQFEQTSGP